MAQQTFFENSYGQQPSSAKGNWLARVSHRASHIPNRPSVVLTPAATATGAKSRDSLPLRTPGTSGFVTHGELPVPQKTSSYPSSPAGPDSPAETEFAATPIDASFGDRVEPPTLSDRAALQQQQKQQQQQQQQRQRASRRGTLTQTDLLRQEAGETMDKYAVQAGDSTYDSDAEADDEFERSTFTSPMLPQEYDDDDDDMTDHPSETEDEQDSLDGDDTPTTQGWADPDGRSPVGKISDWTEEEVADFVAALSPALKQYAQRVVEEGISGDVLVAVGHDELRELGITSVGHRLTLLKAVYAEKMRSGVQIEEGDYVPLSAEGEKAEMTATQEDITRIIESIRLRDQRIIAAEADLRAMRQELDRISEDNRKLREETLPIMRLMKDQRTPLPDPSAPPSASPRDSDVPRLQSQQSQQLQQDPGKGSSLSRKFSKRLLPLTKDALKQSSPTMTNYSPNIRDDGQPHLEASAAALAASSHLTASMTSQPSSNSLHGTQISPTSPAYSMQQPHSATYYQPGSAAMRTFPRDGSQSARPEQRSFGHSDEPSIHNISYSGNTPNDPSRPPTSRRLPTPSPREDESQSGGRAEKDNPQVEIFKSFRVSIDDPCRVVLPVALKRYNITDDWRQYALYIVHGDQERCLGLEEKPLMLFKQLDKEGRKPMFMLRRHASPQEGWSSTTAHSDTATRVCKTERKDVGA